MHDPCQRKVQTAKGVRREAGHHAAPARSQAASLSQSKLFA